MESGVFDDPLLWDEDRVVFEVCFKPDSAFAKVPNRSRLEQTLRDNNINGECLCELDLETLKHELGIASYGQRMALLRVVKRLRNSPVPLSAEEKVRSFQQGLPTPQMTNSRLSLGPSPHYSPSEPKPTIEQDLAAAPASSTHPSRHGPSSAIDYLARDQQGQATAAATGLMHRLALPGRTRNSTTPQQRSPAPPNTSSNDLAKPSNPCKPRQKKRIAPTLVRPIEPQTIDLASLEADAYCGSQPIAIQDIFYRNDAGDDGPELNFISQQQATGAQKVIASLMQHYLRQPIIPLPNTPFRYRMPYNHQQCIGPSSRHLFSLFLKGGVHRVEPFGEWSAQLLKQSTDTSGKVPENGPAKAADLTIMSPGDFDALLQPSTGSGEDAQGLDDFQYLLDKYRPGPDDGEALPLYGESGDENNFDDETWGEIEAERVEQAAASRVMPKQDVSSIIEDSISELEQFWRENKLPRVQARAYSIWLKAATLRIRNPQREANTRMLHRFEARLASLKDAVLAEPWQKESDIRAQCRSMEETVFSILECRHILQVLERNTAPEKPNRKLIKPKPKVAVQLPDGEEILDSDDDMHTFLADDSSSAEDIPFSQEADFDPELPSPTRGTDESHANTADPISAASPEIDRQEKTLQVPQTRQATEDNDADVESDEDDRILSPMDKKRRVAKALTPRRAKKRKTVANKSTDLAESDSDGNLVVLDAGLNPCPPELSLDKAPQTQTIDLTMSDGPEPEQAAETSPSEFEVRTPPLNPIEMSSQQAAEPLGKPEAHDSKPKSSTDLSRMAPEPKTPVNKSRVDHLRLPRLEDVAGIKELPWEKITRSDRLRALYKAVYEIGGHKFPKFCSYLKKLPSDSGEREEILKDGLLSLEDSPSSPRKGPAVKGSRMLLVRLFVTYVCAKSSGTNESCSSSDLHKSFDTVVDASKKFFGYLTQAVHIYKAFLENDKDGAEEASRQGLVVDNDSSSEMSTPDEEAQLSLSVKKRKRAVAESQEAKAHQKTDQQRVLDQELRRKAMKDKFAAISSDDKAHHIINTVEPFVSLDPHIDARAKPHQIAGIQFLWREIIEDPKHQGCLLAHTMGLGKTMQVVSLLVTIAQCNRSSNPKIRRHIPQHLRRSQTLILCPPSLLDNWFDEIVMWLPSNQPDLLGALHKIRSSEDRSIEAWASGGGVMIMSYDLFRSMLKPTENQKLVVSDATLARREEYLLDKATLVVADEAHKMKNATSAISTLARRIKTRSRIALTGSPLNNHLEEYHTMVDWIFPGYLGAMVQFRAKYVEPIHMGLYAESSAYERRVCLKKLHVLKQDLAPKVNRADISALSKDLPPKTEYVITLPLTDFQRKAYDIYARHMLQTYGPTGNVVKEGLFSLVAILTALCNHPWIFMRKFKKRMDRRSGAQEPGKENRVAGADDSDVANASDAAPLPDIDAVSPTDADRSALEEAIAVFQEFEAQGRLQDPALSYRALIVQQILQKSILRGDKVLVFSHSLDTLDYLGLLLDQMQCKYLRIDGKTQVKKRQEMTKRFNSSACDCQVCLISTRAGGLGLNLQAANRVIIYDFDFNPMWEEQAVGRAYRLGQKQPVHVYRFKIGGTVEEVMLNKAIFKTQLFSRVVDKKNPTRQASNKASDYLFLSRDVEQRDFQECVGKDPGVLDSIIEESDKIRNIELTETFHKEDDEKLNDQELKEAEEEYDRQRLERDDPEAYRKKYVHAQIPLHPAAHPIMGLAPDPTVRPRMPHADALAALFPPPNHISPQSSMPASNPGSAISHPIPSQPAVAASNPSAIRYQPAAAAQSCVASGTLAQIPAPASAALAKTASPVLGTPATTQAPAPGTLTKTPTAAPGTPTKTPTPAPGTLTKTPTPAPGTLTKTPTPAPSTLTKTPTPAPGTLTKTPTPAPGTVTKALSSVAQSQEQDSRPVPGLRHSSLERANRLVGVVVPGKSPTRRLVFFIPGNPGLIGYYTEFLSRVRDGLLQAAGTVRVGVAGLSLGGFEVEEGQEEQAKDVQRPGRGDGRVWGNGRGLFGLRDQIELCHARIEAIVGLLAQQEEARTAEARTAEARTAEVRTAEARRAEARTAEARTAEARTAEARTAEARRAEARTAEARTAEPRQRVDVILIGHSVGAYIALEVIKLWNDKEHGGGWRPRAAVLLMPTVIDLHKSASGQIATPILTTVGFVPELVQSLATAVRYALPPSWLKGLVSRVTGMQGQGLETTVSFLTSARGVNEALHLARDEVAQIRQDKWGEEIWGVESPELYFLFAQQDHWVADATRKEIRTDSRMPGRCGRLGRW
ncbi:hypothetical protein DV735_g3751, partial [Chaetothyriales sp. CBS 134920]